MAAIRGLRPVSVLLALISAALVLLGNSTSILMAIVASVALGASGLMTAATLGLHIQRSITQDIRGRVLSLFTWAWGGFLPLGGLFLGFVSEQTSIRTALIVLAGTQLIVALAVAVVGRRT